LTEFAPEPAAAPELAEPAAPEAPAEESWGGVTQEDWETTQQALAYIANAITPQQPQPQQPGYQPPEPVQLDPLDENFQTQLDQYLEQKLAPYADYTQQAILGEAEQRAADILTDITARDGDFLFDGSVEKARALANSYVGQMAQQYGFGPQAAEQALEQAAKDVRAWEQAVGQAYHDRQINQLSTLGGAPREPGAAGNGSQQFVIPQGGTLLDVVKRHTGG
jgi:hypothetical protein